MSAASEAARGEAAEGHLVRRGRRDLGAGGEEVPVRRDDRVRPVEQQPADQRAGGQVVAARLQRGGEPAVQDDDALAQGVGQGGGVGAAG